MYIKIRILIVNFLTLEFIKEPINIDFTNDYDVDAMKETNIDPDKKIEKDKRLA